jgi:hypothetical protein
LSRYAGSLSSLSSDQLEPINVDPLASVSSVLGALPRILLLREEIVYTLPRFDTKHLERLELYALALMAAHSLYCSVRGLQKERAEMAHDR